MLEEGHVTVVPVDRVQPLLQGASGQLAAAEQGKEAGNDRVKGVLGKQGDWSSRDQSPCTARYCMLGKSGWT